MHNDHVPRILLAEDNPADVFLVREAIRTHKLTVDLMVFDDGEALIRFIEAAERDEKAACAGLVLLDLNLPKKNGLEVLARLRDSAKWGKILVVIISSSRLPTEASESAPYKADYFFTKPSDYDRFMELGALVGKLLPAVASATR